MVRLQDKEGHIVILEGAKDQVRHTAGKFFQVENVSHLGADLAHQRELLNPPALNRHLMGSLQSGGRLDGQAVEEFNLVITKRGTGGSFHLQHAQNGILGQ